MARTARPVGALVMLLAMFCAGAAVFWSRCVWAPPPTSYEFLHVIFAALLLVALLLLGTGIVVALGAPPAQPVAQRPVRNVQALAQHRRPFPLIK